MKTVSFSDIKRASWLQGFNEVDMLSIDMDDKVGRVLHEAGIDLDFGVEYYAAQHRNLTGEVLVGYIACGETQINRAHLSSAYASAEDRLIASAYQDSSLTKELASLRGLQRSYEFDAALEVDADVIGGKSRTYVEPEAEATVISKQIKELNALIEGIRGPAHGPSGALKTYDEYKQFALERAERNNKGKQ